MTLERRSIASLVLGMLAVAATAAAEFPADGTAPTEGWPYGFRSVIDTASLTADQLDADPELEIVVRSQMSDTRRPTPSRCCPASAT